MASKATNALHQALKGASTPGSSNDNAAKCEFIHLHTHSAYSLLEGALPLAKLVDRALQDKQPAVAVTDRNNLFGALEFSEKAATAGLQPIIGCMLAVKFSDEFSDGAGTTKTDYPFLVLLAASESGFGNLTKLVSHAHLTGTGIDVPHVTFEDLSEHENGIICLTGADEGPINPLLDNGNQTGAQARLDSLKVLFGDRLYVELQRHGSERRRTESALIELAYENEIPLVATNQPYFGTREDFEAHDALICIADGAVINMDNRRRLTSEHYFKSQAEMKLLFRDLPEAIENTVEIARRCSFRPQTRDPILPWFAVSSDTVEDPEAALEAEFSELKAQAEAGLKVRLDENGMADGFSVDEYEARLDFELNVINQMKYPGYFLIVADFIIWAKERDIPVGPGRGSGAGSLVAWSLTITDIDPMRFSLLFERFLNPERVSMPDFDIDFCQDRREEVIHYVQEKYGADQVAQIITFGTLQARAVLRDVGRVLQMPYGQVDRLCKLVPNNPANPVTLTQAIDGEPKLQEARREEEIVDVLFNIATRLEGLYRHASTHAAGIVIGDRKLDELVPLYRDPRSEMPVTQYNMKWVEQAGLVKFDFLGLKTLTVLDHAVKFLARRGVVIDLARIPLDEPKAFEMLSRGETVGVFQLEGQGMRKALVGMRPDRFEDIIALVALYRPGPMDNIPTYNARKHGEEQPDYYHEKIEEVLKETYGVIIYQEQVMQIAQILSGYSLGEADILRRAMGKKIRSEMDKQRSRFVNGAEERGLQKNQANMIFDLLAKFADYGFNKSHAAAYALVSYQTAWVKANYPVEFLAASMQLDQGNTDKLNTFYQEAGNLEIEVIPPNVNRSGVGFDVEGEKILYALAAIKGVGEGAAEQIVSTRENGGQFQSLADFFSRLDIRQVNKRTIENLICAGAFDCFGRPREQLLAGIERLMGHANRTAQDRETGQNDMFGQAGEDSAQIELPNVEPWVPSEKLNREFQSVGFYLSAHPLDEFKTVLDRMRVQLFSDFEVSVRSGATAGRLAGTITVRQDRKTRQGKRMSILTVSDPSGQYEAIMFEETLNQFGEFLEAGMSAMMLVNADISPEGIGIRIQSAEPIEKVASREQKEMTIFVRDPSPIDNLPTLLERGGEGHVSIVVMQDNGAREIEVRLKDRFRLSSRVQSALKSVPGVVDVSLH